MLYLVETEMIKPLAKQKYVLHMVNINEAIVNQPMIRNTSANVLYNNTFSFTNKPRSIFSQFYRATVA